MTVPTLHVQSIGQGRDLVMLHGWAMHSGYFEPVLEQLAQDFRVHLVDIPGHGRSHSCPQQYSIEYIGKEIFQILSPRINDEAIWLGWSMGASVATWTAAHESKKISALILVASNPRFVQQSDWSHGIENKVLQDFASELIRDYEKTLLRFLSLQIRGAINERDLLRVLRNQMRNLPAPEVAALIGGLEILQQFDGRDILQNIKQPVFVIAGQKDTLVPVSALQTMAKQSDKIKLSEWAGTGHAPFLTDPNRFSNEVKAFADGLDA